MVPPINDVPFECWGSQANHRTLTSCLILAGSQCLRVTSFCPANKGDQGSGLGPLQAVHQCQSSPPFPPTLPVVFSEFKLYLAPAGVQRLCLSISPLPRSLWLTVCLSLQPMWVLCLPQLCSPNMWLRAGPTLSCVTEVTSALLHPLMGPCRLEPTT